MFSCGLTQVIHTKLSLFFHSKHNARISVTGSYASLSSSIFLSTLFSLPLLFAPVFIVASLNTFWSNQFLMFCFTIVINPYLNSYELVTVIAVARC
ncbi:unnamed protein product [Hymenolepis diminuta]|uniref:Uncharacterized protein n=1 Tax=Hymenolepis diminuta TaxID=6216 RepID=A0A564Z802_HYMDI|nr:unnamed protein product [Hymenolepis diminuta]